jgi:hypothetical protein
VNRWSGLIAASALVRHDGVVTSSARATDEALRGLIDEYRDRCLWFLAPGYYPRTPPEILRVLDSTVRVSRERPGLVEAEVLRDDEIVIVQWARESAYRFFPLVRHDDLGLGLHPFDLATSKVLALVGRVEPRDCIDTLTCAESRESRAESRCLR